MANTDIFTTFNTADIVPNQEEVITRALFSNNDGNLTTFFTSSGQTATQKRYYYEIFNSSSNALGSEAQFSIAYGQYNGSGSADEGGQINDTPTRAIYGQYKQLCLDPGERKFTINGRTTNSIYVINVNRARLRESLDVGTLEINIAHLSGSQFIAGPGSNSTHTGSNVRLAGNNRYMRLIDDSKSNPASVTTAGKVYNLVSGSLESGVYNPSNPQKFGLVYPNLGIVVMDGTALDKSASFGTVSGSEVAGDNAFKLYRSMSGSAKFQDLSGDFLGFQARSSEKVKSTHYFVRVRNDRYNFSNNPTFITGSEGDFSQPTFINDPKVYITTVGMYSNSYELLAVAKLSKPLQKSFTREALLKVKLDF
jgi:hypothetical protein